MHREEEEPMTTGTPAGRAHVDQFFTATEARFDRWRRLLDATRGWQATKEGDPGQVAMAFNELKHWEEYFAYPGPLFAGVGCHQ